MSKRFQAKDIPEEQLLFLIHCLSHAPVAYPTARRIDFFNTRTVTLYRIHKFWDTIPPKIITAKLERLMNKGLLEGCACGCRGDFELTEKGSEFLATFDTVLPNEGDQNE